MKQKFYAARHTDGDICRKSSSGGAFTAITDSWFQTYGDTAVVYGCILDENLKARHIRANTPQQRDSMRGSKYIGSDMSGIMNQVEADLKSGNYVLFSGTPCQIGGLRAYLKAKGVAPTVQLLTVEVICHGVGSVRYFWDYVASYEKRYKSKAMNCNFRGKMRPGKTQQMVIWFENGKIYESPSLKYDEFYSVYGSNHILRPSCHNCKYAQPDRNADISLADGWGITVAGHEEKSLVISNTAQGERWIQRGFENVRHEEVSFAQIHQPNMIAPSKRPEDYDRFWNVYWTEGYNGVQRYLGKDSVGARLKNKIVHMMYILRITEIIRMLK